VTADVVRGPDGVRGRNRGRLRGLFGQRAIARAHEPGGRAGGCAGGSARVETSEADICEPWHTVIRMVRRCALGHTRIEVVT
jgi:hypothetical protein